MREGVRVIDLRSRVVDFMYVLLHACSVATDAGSCFGYSPMHTVELAETPLHGPASTARPEHCLDNTSKVGPCPAFGCCKAILGIHIMQKVPQLDQINFLFVCFSI